MFGDMIADALPRMRARAESLMTDTCTIERVTTSSDDDGFIGTTAEPVWSGPCKVQTYEPYESSPEVGKGTVVLQRYSLHIPMSVEGVRVGDRATVGARVFRVGGLSEKTHQTAQRLLVDEQTGGIQ